jgi:3-dehydroquinate synthetase
MGMMAETEVGERLQVTTPGTRDRLAALLRHCGLPVSAPSADADALLLAMRVDKKARGGTPRLPLLLHIGQCAGAGDDWTHAVPESLLRTAVEHLADTT